MSRRILVMGLLVSMAASGAADPVLVWNSLSKPAFDPDKSARVSNGTLTRDRLRITFIDGLIQFARPAEGVVFAAGFIGHGRIQVKPPDDIEAYQLRLLTGQDSLDMNFTEAALTFADSTFDEIAGQVQWVSSPETQPAKLYQARQQAREDVGAEVLPRLFKSVLSADPKHPVLCGRPEDQRERMDPRPVRCLRARGGQGRTLDALGYGNAV
ncbi:MAG: hypothetical protein HY238_18620 [Acidobacteria bacterium]|nr:hypothetical protein [Acidobacteriota bacterium]